MVVIIVVQCACTVCTLFTCHSVHLILGDSFCTLSNKTRQCCVYISFFNLNWDSVLYLGGRSANRFLILSTIPRETTTCGNSSNVNRGIRKQRNLFTVAAQNNPVSITLVLLVGGGSPSCPSPFL